jgi:hypothetical protein
MSVLMAMHPIVIAIIVLVGLITSIFLFRLIRRALRKLFRREATAGAV